jgi:hypothetical protein
MPDRHHIPTDLRLASVAESPDAHLDRLFYAVPAVVVLGLHAIWWLAICVYALWKHEVTAAINTASFAGVTIAVTVLLAKSLRRRLS